MYILIEGIYLKNIFKGFNPISCHPQDIYQWVQRKTLNDGKEGTEMIL